MSQYRVQTIEDEAKKTRKILSRKGGKFIVKVSSDGMIEYCDKVLFLCRQIRKLNHQQ